MTSFGGGKARSSGVTPQPQMNSLPGTMQANGTPLMTPGQPDANPVVNYGTPTGEPIAQTASNPPPFAGVTVGGANQTPGLAKAPLGPPIMDQYGHENKQAELTRQIKAQASDGGAGQAAAYQRYLASTQNNNGWNVDAAALAKNPNASALDWQMLRQAGQGGPARPVGDLSNANGAITGYAPVDPNAVMAASGQTADQARAAWAANNPGVAPAAAPAAAVAPDNTGVQTRAAQYGTPTRTEQTAGPTAANQMIRRIGAPPAQATGKMYRRMRANVNG